jgi:hypothetical protein
MENTGKMVDNDGKPIECDDHPRYSSFKEEHEVSKHIEVVNPLSNPSSVGKMNVLGLTRLKLNNA